MAKIVHLRNIKRALTLEPVNSKSVKYVIGGRVSNYRTYKSFNFIDLIDGSTQEHLQVVVNKNILQKPELGSYLICQGDIISSRGAQQALEFKVDQLEFIGKCDPMKYPLAEANKSHIPDGWFRRNLHLRPRANHFASLLRVRSELEMSMHMIFRQMDFFKVHTPILTANDSEASSDLFTVHRSKYLDGHHVQSAGNVSEDEGGDDDSSDHSDDDILSDSYKSNECTQTKDQLDQRRIQHGYFKNKDVFMITSAQLHLESLAASLSRVYCLAPTFRAESTLSQRHLCEFTMLEAEESNLTSLSPLMDRVEAIIKFSAQYLREVSEFRDDFARLLSKNSNEQTYEKLTDSKYIRMTYDEAIDILQQRSLKSKLHGDLADCHHGCDLNRKHERVLLAHCNNVPIFLTNYPKRLKPFYMKVCDDLPDKVQNFDLIAPHGGEICGGSLREDDLDTLLENLKLVSPDLESELHRINDGDVNSNKLNNQSKHPFAWYLELREFGSFPHGGFGIGFERLIQTLLGVKNIKDTIAYPRWPGNCSM